MKHAISNQSWTSSNCILTLQNKFCSCMHFKKSGFPNIHSKIVNSRFYSKLVDIENGAIWFKTCFYRRWVNWLYLCKYSVLLIIPHSVRYVCAATNNNCVFSAGIQLCIQKIIKRLTDLIFIKPIVMFR